MKPYSRAERVGGLIKTTLSEIIQRSIKDPRLDSVALTGVKMTADLKLARIYFVTSGNPDDAAAGFRKAHGFIKHALAGKLDLRFMPELQFFYDNSIDYGMHIDSVLRQLKKENGADPQSTEEE